MSNLSQFFSGTPNFPLSTRYFISSGTWVAPGNGWATFLLVGGGGSGGTVDDFTYGSATGGGAGGLCVKRAYVTAGLSLTVTIGAGGTAAAKPLGQGVAGGATTVSGTGFSTLTANGGSGGVAVGNNTAINGGAGGTASGGDVNITGGRGGNVATQTTNTHRATGGGSVGIYGVGYEGGDLGDVNGRSLTGGAGVGGSGVHKLSGNGNTAAGLSLTQTQGLVTTIIPISNADLLAPQFYGISLQGNASAGAGCGRDANQGNVLSAAGMFGGGAAGGGSSVTATGGAGGIGGGGGACAGSVVTNGASGAGGAGFAMVLFHGA